MSVSQSGEFPLIEELLPHRGDMLLIERVTAAERESLTAQTSVRSDAWYADTNGEMPAWLGIELMAQAIAAYVGWQQRCQGKPIKIGFLLGTRKFTCTVPTFTKNSILDIYVRLAYREANGLGAFDCYITAKGKRVAEAAIKVFEPDDPARFMSGATP